MFRALMFGCVYVALAYAAAPKRNASDEYFVCVMRACSASVWVLAATTWMLVFAPVQVCIILFSRLGDDDVDAAKAEAQPLNGAQTPDRVLGDGMGQGMGVVDVTDAELGLGTDSKDHSGTGLRFTLAGTQLDALNGGRGSKDGFGGLSVQALAAIAAREGGCDA